MTMKYARSWKYNIERFAGMVILTTVLGMTVGCDSSARPAVEQVPDFTGELVLANDAPVSGGAMAVTLEIAPPDDILRATPATGKALVTKEEADIHFEAQIRYTAGILGGRNEGDFVPYLNVSLTLTNRDSGKTLTTTLVPHVGIAEGYHYARNLALVDSLGASEAGYDADVTIDAPTEYGSPGTSDVSPGLIKHSDISGTNERAGTLLGTDSTVVSGGFILGDFKDIVSTEIGGNTSGTGSGTSAPPPSLPPGGGYAY